MDDRERMSELHLALDGAVDQLGAAQRLAAGTQGDPSPWMARIDALFGQTLVLRNEVRDHLLKILARPRT